MPVLHQLATTFLQTDVCTLKALPNRDVFVLIDALNDLLLEHDLFDAAFECVTQEPYNSIEELAADFEVTRVLKVKYREATLIPANVYTFFRGVHDLIHHYKMGFTFEPTDEFRAGMHLASLLWSKSELAASYAFCDVAGFNAVYELDPSLWEQLHPKLDVRLLNPYTWQPLAH
jgi:hypothetical protein